MGTIGLMIKMRVLYLTNNLLGRDILKWLLDNNKCEVVGLVIHPDSKAKYKKEILDIYPGDDDSIILGNELHNEVNIEKIKKMNVDLGISISFDYLIRKEVFNLPGKGCVNLHTAYLPYNRGQYPNVWAIVENTPAGITLHKIDDKIDTGEIISQVEVPIEPYDTGLSLFNKLQAGAFELFRDSWELLEADKIEHTDQRNLEGTYHRTKDVENIDEIDLEKKYRAQYLIDVLRARSFPPYDGAYFMINGKKIFMRLELYEEQNEE
jgi:methionyl-tRNA formyltransferase